MTPAFWIFWALGLAVSTIVGSYVVKNYRQHGLLLLGTMLAIYVVGANILVPRLVELKMFGMSFVLVTGSIIWPFTAQLSDMINEIYGKKSAYTVAAIAYLANAMFAIFTLMAFQIPPLEAGPAEDFFRSFFGIAWRVMFASMCSYTVSNIADITVFSAIKKWAARLEQNAGSLLLYSSARSMISDFINLSLDSLVFYTIAFIGTMPFETLWGLVVTSTIAKVIIGQIDLPFYWVFRLITKEVKRDF